MFVDSNAYPFCRELEESWHAVRQEFDSIPQELLIPWPNRYLYGEGWNMFPLVGFQVPFPRNCAMCPQTARLANSVPGMTTAGFSILEAGTEILPHAGFTNTVLRCHLGIHVPDECAIRVGDETRPWRDGKCLVFDDMVTHSAWNRSNERRVVLLIDFLKDGVEFDIEMPEYLRQELAPLLRPVDD